MFSCKLLAVLVTLYTIQLIMLGTTNITFATLDTKAILKQSATHESTEPSQYLGLTRLVPSLTPVSPSSRPLPSPWTWVTQMLCFCSRERVRSALVLSW